MHIGAGSFISTDSYPPQTVPFEKETSEHTKDVRSGEVTENYKDSSLARVRREYVVIIKQLVCHGADPRRICNDHGRTISALQFVNDRLRRLFQKYAADILIQFDRSSRGKVEDKKWEKKKKTA
jgi:hypothetical protein